MSGKALKLFALICAVTCFLLIYSPLLYLGWLSFRIPDYEAVTGWTLRHYEVLFSDHGLLQPLWQSVRVAFFSALIAIPIALATALLLERGKPLFPKSLEVITVLPLALPELVLGIALLTWFSSIGLSLGTWTIALGHAIYSFPFAMIIMRTRLRSMDASLDDAARDLGATRSQLFFWITLPLLKPAIGAAFLLCILLSFDDFIVAFFTAGVGSDTLPLKLYSAMKFSFEPQLYALAVLMMLLTVMIVVITLRLVFFERPEEA